jgi:hypothetical protein
MENLIGLAVVLVVFAGVVVSVVYFTGFEKESGLPTRRPIYILIGALLAAAILLFLLYETGVINLGMS